MLDWLKKKISSPREVSLPGNVGSMLVPNSLQVEEEDDSTLMFFRPGDESITLRASSISFTKVDATEVGGIEQILERARELNAAVQEFPDKAVLAFDEETVENGVPLIIRYWEIGSLNTIVILSATIIKSESET